MDIKAVAKDKRFKFLIVVLILGLIVVSYYSFFYRQKCSTDECFLTALKDCKRAKLTLRQNSGTWFYIIKGPYKDTCRVYVKAKEIETEIKKMKAMEGKSMTCFLPRELAIFPEERIEYCSGLLKETIQDQIIERMHLYIVENIGQIEESLSGI